MKIALGCDGWHTYTSVIEQFFIGLFGRISPFPFHTLLLKGKGDIFLSMKDKYHSMKEKCELWQKLMEFISRKYLFCHLFYCEIRLGNSSILMYFSSLDISKGIYVLVLKKIEIIIL